MSNNRVIDLIRKLAKNEIFKCSFIKRDGTERSMICRLNVKKGVKGTGMSYNPIERGLLPVFDMQKDGFRMINTQTLTSLTIGGVKYV